MKMSKVKIAAYVTIGGLIAAALLWQREEFAPDRSARTFLFEEAPSSTSRDASDAPLDFAEIVTVFPIFESREYLIIHRSLAGLKEFGADEADITRRFFETPTSRLREIYDLDLSDDELASIKNAMLNAWSEHYDKWELLSFTDQAIDIQNLDTLSAEYATQFTYVTNDDLARESTEGETANLSNYINARTLELLDHPSQMVQSTALLAYTHLENTLVDTETQTAIVKASGEILSSRQSSSALKISASQAIARFADPSENALDMLSQSAEQEQDPLVLMALMASASRLDNLPNTQEIGSFLKQFTDHQDSRVAAVANTNLLKLENDS